MRWNCCEKNHKYENMEQNIFDILVDGLDLNAFYAFIDGKTNIENNNTPELVFQYTTWNALFNGIIRSNEEDCNKVHVFSTNCKYMNDPKEVETGEQYVDMALKGFLGDCGECDDYRHRNAIYMSSFSENENSLPMWNLYGKNGNGVSVGFDLNLLRKYSKGTIKKCLYDTPKNRLLFKNTLSKDRGSNCSNSGEKFQQYLMTLMDYAKKGCYEYENEIRLTREILEYPEYRLYGNFLVPYVDNVYPKEVVKKIIIGPCNDFERSTKSLQGWLNKIGMEHVNVTYSMLPYRSF